MAPVSFGTVPRGERAKWITPIAGQLYPDSLDQAKVLYEPILQRFAELLRSASTSEELLMLIVKEQPEMKRRQMLRVFRGHFGRNVEADNPGAKHHSRLWRPLPPARRGEDSLHVQAGD